MVWRKMIISIVLIAGLAALPQPATAIDVPNTFYLDEYQKALSIARDIYISPFDDYVFFSMGNGLYCLAVGKLSFDGQTFTSDSTVTVYLISPVAGYYSVESLEAQSISPGEMLVYSNLGGYPGLIERSDYFALVALFMLATGLCCYLLRSIFSFNLRRRS